ncbi:hypothetical protein [Pseudomonas gingeri]|uniref:hypothetical protein n=1 Tax=Pseudomonas gingeri TaxID=117681 RepID=UPI0015A4C36B|nr:hypothetical protein [Pseudomonas gingeri]NWD08947.1 hypothetical protein [Pseudomonas gingeri]NWE34778.1 hypothetical protein [Pseudomonas gingeri]NWE56879.1 hypothetical protein [Pseudomonas gingeri]NWF02018.1 hypothetical protein [Pseudomonas gingeri]
MKFNIENVQALVSSAYLVHVREAFGEVGEQCILEVLNVVKLIYQTCPPERLKATLTVVRGIASTPLSPVIEVFGSLSSAQSAQEVGALLLDVKDQHHIFIEAVSDGSFRLLMLAVDVDLKSLANLSVVYRFERNTEQILAKEYQGYMPKVSSCLVSNLAIPTQSSLEDAFKIYAKEMALESQCRILKDVWEGGVDGPRLVLKNKPESLMRDSLAHALRLLTRDTTVRPEQNTDETKPVDIRVEWFGSGASALIEIKWLGKAVAISRSDVSSATYTEYSLSRAQDGAKQLADYMDREVRHSNKSAPRGYLVVFDARRKGLKGTQDRLSKSDAQHFETVDLDFSPDYSAHREDFAPAIRMFMRPRESHFLA